ncbi:MAG: hypothetical protein HFI35_14280 [Roseburia sp.]|nr:hypothetical protein [Roseburia sp.]
MNNKLQYKLIAVLFIIILCLFGISSDYKLIDYYINDTLYNEYWNPSLGRKNETEYTVVFLGKRFFVDINGAIRNMLKQQEMNEVCKLDNGHLTALISSPINNETLKTEALNVQKLYLCCKEIGVPFIFIATPDKISPYDNKLPQGETDYSNLNTDVFLQELKKQGVPFIDLREEFYKNGLDQYRYFSKTDHHWNAYGGYYGYLEIQRWLDTEGIVYDKIPSDLNNYTINVYPQKLLGSWGQRTGKYFAGLDDFYVFLPKFETSVTIESGTITASYEDVLIDCNLLSAKTPGFIYDGVYCNTRDVTNNMAKNESSVLLIGDSFSRVVNPYIILSIKKFSWRSTYLSADITRNFLESGDFDAIILLQSPWNNLGREASYCFLTQ